LLLGFALLVLVLVLVPAVWGFLRRGVGLPMYGAPTVSEIDGEKPRRRTAKMGQAD